MVISLCFASSTDCAGEVCQTMVKVAVETMRPIHANLIGSNSPGPPSTLLSVNPS